MSGSIPINPTQIIGATGVTDPGKSLISTGDTPADNVFSGLLNEIVALDNEASTLETAMYAGAPVELHQVMIAGEKAGIAFELLVEARNRLVEAYQELMRMPV